MATPATEYKRRWKLIKQFLVEDSFDAVLIPFGVNFHYFFGKSGTPRERLIAGVVPAEGDPFIICPAFERSNLYRSTGYDDIVVWEETESPYKILEKEFSKRSIGQNIGVDPHLWIVEVERMKKTSSDRDFRSAHQPIERSRRMKSAWEIKQLRLAAQASAEGIYAAFEQLQKGMTEKEVVPILERELSSRSGNPLSFAAVQFAENSAVPHGAPTDKKLANNTVVLMDVGTSVNGYQGDVTITMPFGKPNDNFFKIYDIVYEANRKAFAANGPGMIPADLDKIARDHITENGYGQYFTHRLGHGIGLEVHESPYIVGSNSAPLVAGDTHTIEPGIYIPDKFGVRIEDDVLVTDNGCEHLFEVPRYWWQ